MTVRAQAPCRIDLAGGTLDLEFIYAFLGGAVTVNLAVDVRARAEVRSLEAGKVRLAALDLGAEAAGRSASSIRLPKALALHGKVLAHFGPATGVEAVTEAEAPKGSGLGGSSALLVALAAALTRLQGRRLDKARLVETAARLEASLIGVPTGKQDYLAALYGGLSAHHFGFDGWRVERLQVSPGFLDALSGSLVLAYTGASRLSARANWDKFKASVEGGRRARERFLKLKAVALEMREALLAEDLGEVGRLMARDWALRKGLTAGASSAGLDAALKRLKRSGAVAGKLLGAGGGGCLALMAQEGRRRSVEEALLKEGYRVIDFKVDGRGLRVWGSGGKGSRGGSPRRTPPLS